VTLLVNFRKWCFFDRFLFLKLYFFMTNVGFHTKGVDRFTFSLAKNQGEPCKKSLNLNATSNNIFLAPQENGTLMIDPPSRRPCHKLELFKQTASTGSSTVYLLFLPLPPGGVHSPGLD
jgi:hypothetical protein